MLTSRKLTQAITLQPLSLEFEVNDDEDTLTVLSYSPDDLRWDNIIIHCYNDTASSIIEKTEYISVGDTIDVTESDLEGNVIVEIWFDNDTTLIPLGSYEFYIPSSSSGTQYYTLTIQTIPSYGGTVTVDPPGSVFKEGDVVIIEAHPADGYKFDGWGGDAAGYTDSRITIVMDSDKNIIAYFSESSGENSGDTGSNTGSLAIDIIQPKRGMLHIKGRSIRIPFVKRAIVIGPATIKVSGSEAIDKVIFYVNGNVACVDTEKNRLTSN